MFARFTSRKTFAVDASNQFVQAIAQNRSYHEFLFRIQYATSIQVENKGVSTLYHLADRQQIHTQIRNVLHISKQYALTAHIVLNGKAQTTSAFDVHTRIIGYNHFAVR